METTFAIIAVFQVWENYAAHDWDGEGVCPSHWKAKGGTEVVLAEGMDSNAVISALMLDKDKFIAQAKAKIGDDNVYYRHDLLDLEIAELSRYVLDLVADYIASDKYYGDGEIELSHALNITKYAARWALNELSHKAA